MHLPETFIILATAFGIGALHAFEVDHMTAVSTFIANRPSPRAALRFGLQWATGHGLSLLLFGSVLYLLKLSLTESVAHGLERLVGVALVGLGCWTLLQWKSGRLTHTHSHSHSHDTAGSPVTSDGTWEAGVREAGRREAGGREHTHADGTTHTHVHTHSHGHAHSHGSLWMGMLHGVAGTAGFVSEGIVAIAKSYAMVFAYTLCFSIGVLAAMGAYAALLGGALTWSEHRARRLAGVVRFCAGTWSCLVGVYWIFR